MATRFKNPAESLQILSINGTFGITTSGHGDLIIKSLLLLQHPALTDNFLCTFIFLISLKKSFRAKLFILFFFLQDWRARLSAWPVFD